MNRVVDVIIAVLMLAIVVALVAMADGAELRYVGSWTIGELLVEPAAKPFATKTPRDSGRLELRWRSAPEGFQHAR